MFYLDGISLNKIKDELSSALAQKKIGKITQETELSVSLFFGRSNLVISCANSLPICYLTEDKNLKLEDNFNFVLSLRKFLLNSSLEEVTQIGYDRILCFKFKKLNFLGEVNFYNLYFEIMGRYSNLILTDENGKILDLMKRFSIEENRLRLLFPGADYVRPVLDKKLLPTEIREEDFDILFQDRSDLINRVEGVGKQLANSLKSYEDLKNILTSPLAAKCYLKNGKIVLATVLDIVISKDFDEIKEFSTFSEMVNYFLERNFINSSQEKLFNEINSVVKKRVKRLEKALQNIALDNESKKDYELNKEIGDILAANIYSIKKVPASVTLYNFYRDYEIEIQLNPAHTIQKNIDNYYKKFNKLKRGLISNEKRVVEVQEEIDYLNSILAHATTTQTAENLKNIHGELGSQGYIKSNRKPSKGKKQQKQNNFEVAEENENYKIIFGRNNLENDFVTFKLGEKDDLWFHAKDIPGSHVILKFNREALNDELIEKAARVAINYSKSNPGDKVNVEYTLKKFVLKPKGARPGFVIYTNQKEITLIK